ALSLFPRGASPCRPGPGVWPRAAGGKLGGEAGNASLLPGAGFGGSGATATPPCGVPSFFPHIVPPLVTLSPATIEQWQRRARNCRASPSRSRAPLVAPVGWPRPSYHPEGLEKRSAPISKLFLLGRERLGCGTCGLTS